MKITKKRLKQIIKEEISHALFEQKGPWILVKKSRHVEKPRAEDGYKGKTFDSFEEATEEAAKLTANNPVGFDVVKVDSNDEEGH